MAYKITGWEIVPYSPPMLLNLQSGFSGSSQALKSSVKEGIVRSVFQKDGVISSHPETVKSEMGEEKAVVEQQQSRRVKKTATKFIGVTYISFDYLKLREGSTKNALGMYEDESQQELEMSRLSDDERMLPLPGLLKGWRRETRQRQNGLRDKFYTHPLSNKKFRSMISVLNFIRSSNNILNPQNSGNSEQEPQIQATPHHHEASSSGVLHEHLQATPHHHEASSSSSDNKKRKNGFQIKSESNKRRIFPIAFAKDDDKTKMRYKQKIENLLAMAYNNLMKLQPTPFPEKNTAGISHQKNEEPETPIQQDGVQLGSF